MSKDESALVIHHLPNALFFPFKYLILYSIIINRETQSRETSGNKSQTCRCEPVELAVSSWTTCCRRAASRPHSTSRAPAAWKTRAHSTTQKTHLLFMVNVKHLHHNCETCYCTDLPTTQLKWTSAYQRNLICEKHLHICRREDEMRRRPTFPQSRSGPRDDHHSVLQSSSWSEANKYPIKQQGPCTC